MSQDKDRCGLERNNLWAPWRMNYIKGIDKSDECFLCTNLANEQDDIKSYVLWRTRLSMVVMNMYPYNNGHLLIAPNRHIADLIEATEDELLDMMRLIRDCEEVLKKVISPQGFNVGMNFGRCAGAGLPGHLHIHVVPRWNGDTNFIHVCGDTDVISQSLRELYDGLTQASVEMDLPMANRTTDRTE